MAVWRLQILFKKHNTHLNSIGDSISNQVSCEFSLVLHSHELGFSPEKVLPSLCDAYFFRGFHVQQRYMRCYKFHSLELMGYNLGS